MQPHLYYTRAATQQQVATQQQIGQAMEAARSDVGEAMVRVARARYALGRGARTAVLLSNAMSFKISCDSG